MVFTCSWRVQSDLIHAEQGGGSGDQRGYLTLLRLHSSVQVNIRVIAKLLLIVPVELGYNLLLVGGT